MLEIWLCRLCNKRTNCSIMPLLSVEWHPPWNTNSDSKGDSSAIEGPTQSQTPSIWSTALCRTACLPSQPSSMSSTPRPASSHWISVGFHQQGTGSPSRESGDRRIHSPWKNLNVPPWRESPAALEPLLKLRLQSMTTHGNTWWIWVTVRKKIRSTYQLSVSGWLWRCGLWTQLQWPHGTRCRE